MMFHLFKTHSLFVRIFARHSLEQILFMISANGNQIRDIQHKLHSFFRIRTYSDNIAATNNLITIQFIQSFHNRFKRWQIAVYIRYNSDFHDFTCKFNTKYLFS